MLFFIFIILFCIGLFLHFLFEYDLGDTIGTLLYIFSAIAIVISLIIMAYNYVTKDAFIKVNEECYKALTYKVESDICCDEFGLLNKEVIDEVQEWNQGVIYYQNIQRNFWVGIYYPNVFDDFKTIDYDNFER